MLVPSLKRENNYLKQMQTNAKSVSEIRHVNKPFDWNILAKNHTQNLRGYFWEMYALFGCTPFQRSQPY